MGYPPEQQFNVSFDSTQLIQQIDFDTVQQLQYEKRIEYQQLETEKKLQRQLTDYYKLAFLPTVSAFYNYFMNTKTILLPIFFRGPILIPILG